MSATALPSTVDGPAAFERQFNVSRETVAKLVTYADLLKHWQKTINLVAPGTLDAVWHRHMSDSAQLLALAPPGAKPWSSSGFISAGSAGSVSAPTSDASAATTMPLRPCA